MADEAWIYALADQYGVPRYIGKARDPLGRAKQHARESWRHDRPVHRWLRKQAKANFHIEVLFLEECGEDWPERERSWIAAARAAGADLLNVAPGGNQPYCSPEQRKALGEALVDRLRTDRLAAARQKRGWMRRVTRG